jgi:hypothetical protein
MEKLTARAASLTCVSHGKSISAVDFFFQNYWGQSRWLEKSNNLIEKFGDGTSSSLRLMVFVSSKKWGFAFKVFRF